MSANPLALAMPPVSGLAEQDNYLAPAEMIVMLAELSGFDYSIAADQLPMKSIDRFVDAALQVGVLQPSVGTVLSQVLEGIRPQIGLFVQEFDARPVATAICVQDDELAGLFEVASHSDYRRRGFARSISLTALRWGWMRGARRAWLQVGTDNHSAIGLYHAMGFQDLYRYRADELPAA